MKNRLDEAKRNVLRGYVRTIVAKVDKCNYILMTRDGGLKPNEAIPLKRIIDTTFTFNTIKERKGADLVRIHAHIHLADKDAQREFTLRGVNYKVEELTVKDFRF